VAIRHNQREAVDLTELLAMHAASHQPILPIDIDAHKIDADL
jgi:hypothetical protein